MKQLLLILTLITFPLMGLSTPATIIVVRHGDKLLEPASKWQNRQNDNRSLDAKGMVRSVKLAFYILKHFGPPDYIFASTPVDSKGKTYSLREVETAGPLATMLADRNPHGFKVLFPYTVEEYKKLAHFILNKPQFNQKVVLIVWAHQVLPALIEHLGVKAKLPHWSNKNFDTVYVLRYNHKGHLIHWRRLDHQYPVNDHVSWDDLAKVGENFGAD